MNQKNLANGLILTSAGDVITLYPGYVDDMPAVPFFATASKLGEIATLDNSEIVRVTAIDGDNLTCDRAQRGTVEQVPDDGWVLGNGIYTEDLAALKAYTDSAIATAITAAVASTKSALYPIGSIYYNATDSTNPATLLGFGTWVNTLIGTAPVGKAASGQFSTVGAVVGSETARQGSIVWGINSNNEQDSGGTYLGPAISRLSSWLTGGGSSVANRNSTVQAVGGGVRTNGANNVEVSHLEYTSPTVQPSQVVNAWRRTA